MLHPWWCPSAKLLPAASLDLGPGSTAVFITRAVAMPQRLVHNHNLHVSLTVRQEVGSPADQLDRERRQSLDKRDAPKRLGRIGAHGEIVEEIPIMTNPQAFSRRGHSGRGKGGKGI